MLGSYELFRCHDQHNRISTIMLYKMPPTMCHENGLQSKQGVDYDGASLIAKFSNADWKSPRRLAKIDRKSAGKRHLAHDTHTKWIYRRQDIWTLHP
jgi:hypothetical protein